MNCLVGPSKVTPLIKGIALYFSMQYGHDARNVSPDLQVTIVIVCVTIGHLLHRVVFLSHLHHYLRRDHDQSVAIFIVEFGRLTGSSC